MQPLVPSAPFRRGVLRGLWIFVGLGSLLGWYVYSDYVFEDAYITLRFGQNLAEGNGLVFQSGEAVLGTSSPLWALLLAAFVRAGLDPEFAIDLCFAASLGLLAVAGYALLARAGLRRAGALFALASVAGFAQVHTYWGMETPLFVALLLGTWWLACDGRSTAAGLALGAACLTRYEGYAFASCLLPAYALARGWRPAWRMGWMTAALCVPWLVYAWSHYGSPLPSTCAAKATAFSAFSYLDKSIRQLPDEIWLPLPAQLRTLSPLFCVALAAAALGGVLVLVRRRAWLLLALPCGAALMFAVLAEIAPSPIFAWHRTPLWHVLFVTALLGVGPWLERRPRVASVIGATLVGLCAFLPGSLHKLRDTYNYAARVGAYQDMAEFLQQPALENHTLLTGEPGYLAFRTGLRMIDAAGLVTPAPQEPAQGEWDSDFPEEADLLLLRAPYRPRSYEVVHESPMGALLMMRRDLADALRPDLNAYFAQDPKSAARPLSTGPHAIHCALPRKSVAPLVHAALSGTPYTLGCNGKPRVLTADSAPLRLDRPYLVTDFTTSHPGLARLQLVVRGRVVLQTGPQALPVSGRVCWDVRPFANRVARVRVMVLTGTGARAHYGSVRGSPSPNSMGF